MPVEVEYFTTNNLDMTEVHCVVVCRLTNL